MPTRTHTHLPNRPVPQTRNLFSPFINLSLRLKFMIAFLAVTALAVGIVAFFTDRIIRAELTDQAGATLISISANKTAEIGQTIQKEEDTLKTIALNKLVQDAVKAASVANPDKAAEAEKLDRQWRAADSTANNADPLVAAVLNNEVADELREFQAVFPQHAEIFVTDQHSLVVAATNRTSDYYQADEAWWQAAYQNGQGEVFISQPEFDDSAGIYAINIAMPVFSHNSTEIAGILRTTLNIDVFTNVLETGRFGQTGHTDIYLPDGREIELEGEDGQFEVAIEEGAIAPAALEQFRLGTSYLADSHDEEQSLMAGTLITSNSENSAGLENITRLGWVVVAVQDYAEALQPVETAAQTTLLVALGALVAAGLLGLGAAQLLAAPITRLTEVITRIARGDLRIQAPVESGDEIGTLATSFNQMTGQLQDTLTDLERRVADRTRGLELAAKVAQEIATVRSLDRLLAQAVQLIHTIFGLYHTQIYLTDPTGRTLTLQAATGSIGEQLLRRGHRLPIKIGSINGTAAAEKRSVVVADTTQSATFLPNPLLPDTRSEIAVPLMVGERVVGVLDMQHDFVDALSEENLPAFEALAGQLAIAIENARLFVETEQARTEIELHTRRLTGAGWSEFLDGVNRSERLGFNYEAGTIVPLAQVLPEAQDEHTLAAPITINDNVVGQLQLEEASGHNWTSTEMELINAVADQVGQQLENLRLLAQAEQYQAEAEAAVRLTTRQGWTDYVNNLTPLNSGYGYDQTQVTPLLELNDSETALTQPLTIRGETIGELLVEADPELADEAAELLNVIAEQLSARLENARLTEQTAQALAQTEEQADRLAALNELSEALNRVTDINMAYAVVAAKTPAILQNERVSIALLTPTDDNCNLLTLDGEKGAIPSSTLLPLAKTASGRAIRQNRVLNHTASLESQDLDLRQAAESGLLSTLIAPLLVNGQVIGTLNFDSRRLYAFTKFDEDVVRRIASLLASTIENKQLLNQLTLQEERLRSLYSITTQTDLSPEQQFEALLAAGAELLGLNMGIIGQVEDERYRVLYFHGPTGTIEKDQTCELGQTFCALTLKANHIVSINQVGTSQFSGHPCYKNFGLEVYIGVPLWVKGQRFGTLNFACSTPKETPFTQADEDFVQLMGQWVSAALERKQQEEMLAYRANEIEQANRYLDSIIENMPTMLFVKDAENLNFVRWNKAAEELVGHSREAVLGKNDYDFFPEVEADFFTNKDREVLNGNQIVDIAEEPLQTAHKGLRYMHTRKVPIYDAEGNPSYLLGIAEDITERKQAEEALRENESRLTNALKTAKLAYWEFDVASEIFTFNDQFYALLHTTAEQEGGYLMSAMQYAQKFVHPDEAYIVGAVMSEAIDSTDPNFTKQVEHRFIRADGSEGHILVRFREVKDAQGVVVKRIGANQDITERKQAQQTLLLHDEAMASSENGITIADASQPDLPLIYVNAAFERITGYSASEVLNRNCRFLQGPETNQPALDELRSALKTGRSCTVVLRNYRKDGTLFWNRLSLSPILDAAGNLTHFVGVQVDITEQIQAEETIAKRAAELQTVAQVSTAASTILETSHLLQRVVDLTKESFGLYHAHIYLLNEASDTLALAAGAGEVGQKMVAQGWQIPLNREKSLVARAARSKEGVIVNDVQADPEFLPNPLLPETRSEMAVPLVVGDKVLGVLDVQADRVNRFSAEDIHIQTTLAAQIAAALENARLFEESKRTAERLREVDRLKSEFLANMSHELRTPLNSIIGYSEMMLMGISGEIPPELNEDIEAIYENGKHLLQLISDILDLAKIEAGRLILRFESVGIEALLDEIKVNNTGLFLKKEIEFRVEAEENLPMILADPLRLNQVLNNLISNAAKFTNEGYVKLRAYQEYDRLCVDVEDTGIGMSEEDLNKIFEKFMQVDGSFTRRAEGTGLGLAITRHLVEMHGGQIEVRSQLNQGTTFTVRLPIETEDTDEELLQLEPTIAKAT